MTVGSEHRLCQEVSAGNCAESAVCRDTNALKSVFRRLLASALVSRRASAGPRPQRGIWSGLCCAVPARRDPRNTAIDFCASIIGRPGQRKVRHERRRPKRNAARKRRSCSESTPHFARAIWRRYAARSAIPRSCPTAACRTQSDHVSCMRFITARSRSSESFWKSEPTRTLPLMTGSPL